jgi:hypothetical protein
MHNRQALSVWQMWQALTDYDLYPLYAVSRSQMHYYILFGPVLEVHTDRGGGFCVGDGQGILYS